MVDLSVIVLAYNEAENVGAVLDELQRYLKTQPIDAEILLVDDGSADGTGDAARPSLRPGRDQMLRHVHNRGMGAGLKTGVAAARGEFVTFMPADGQIEPEAIGTLLRSARENDSDVVFSVYEDRDDGVLRKVLSAGVRGLITLTHGVRLRSDGPYLFKRNLFLPEQLPSDTFFINFEFPIGAVKAGLRTSLVTIRCRARRAGVSKTARARVVVDVGRELLALRARRTGRALRQYIGG